MLTADHPNAIWLAEMYSLHQRLDDECAHMTAEERHRRQAELIAEYMSRMSPNLIIHTGGVQLAVTADMAFMRIYARRRASLSDGGDVSIVKLNQVLADDTFGILHFHARTARGGHVWERTGMGAWRFEDGIAVEHWELCNGPAWDAYYLAGDPDFNGDAFEYWTRI
jgi:predicted SnoaL-like aldol condensation-catalyzing enzyme